MGVPTSGAGPSRLEVPALAMVSAQMKNPSRRRFLQNTLLGVGSAAVTKGAISPILAPGQASETVEAFSGEAAVIPPAIDFRYSPAFLQTAYCFPDDHYKSLIGQNGELRCGNPGLGYDNQYFPEIVEFSVLGMERDQILRQWLEAPGVPIVHTSVERPEAFLEIIAFATRRPDEGRVDNVFLQIHPRSEKEAHAVPLIRVNSQREMTVRASGPATVAEFSGPGKGLFLAADSPLSEKVNFGRGWEIRLNVGAATDAQPLRCFIRLPQEGQSFERIQEGLRSPDRMLEEVRSYWLGHWSPYEGEVSWRLPADFGDFLVACARNIQQAREVKNGKLTFQVGPTVYRGLWIVDGNFILEAARYLGYDNAAQQGRETEWSHQLPDGQIVAAAGREHWKDTGIAMFTLVRQAELSQDWTYFRKMQPQVLKAVRFLVNLRQQARRDGGVMGRYGLLPPGFGDGGLGGVQDEFTNTLWVLAGLKTVNAAALRLGLSGFEPAEQLYQDLRLSFFAAARLEMRQYSTGFEYLPMLMKEDPEWSVPDAWARPRPQTAQWALSHAIYPGLVFEKENPIVKGHIKLMQACTQEDVPAETGWLHHGGLWTYNAPFVAHVYLWAGLTDWARLTFGGFLNHASPSYCWREEQPLQGSLVAGYVGDMPHNWASAECVLYLRHMLALEDGAALRLLAGIGDFELASGEPHQLIQSPTRFGRINLALEPLDRAQGWRLKFNRAKGPRPESVQLPRALGSRFRFSRIAGAQVTYRANEIFADPEATSWEATWTA
jgi:hypothetical protein